MMIYVYTIGLSDSFARALAYSDVHTSLETKPRAAGPQAPSPGPYGPQALDPALGPAPRAPGLWP